MRPSEKFLEIERKVQALEKERMRIDRKINSLTKDKAYRKNKWIIDIEGIVECIKPSKAGWSRRGVYYKAGDITHVSIKTTYTAGRHIYCSKDGIWKCAVKEKPSFSVGDRVRVLSSPYLLNLKFEKVE